MNFLGIDIGTTSVKTAVFNEALEQKISLTADYTLDAHGGTGAGLDTVWYNVEGEPNTDGLDVAIVDDFKDILSFME